MAVASGDSSRPALPGAVTTHSLGSDAALRLLALLKAMADALALAMRDQGDPDVLDTLYAVDALTCQAQRVAENLHVLSGRPVQDTDRQVTSLADVLHAAFGRIAGWPRIIEGPVIDLAVAEYVSGDLIRVMTELLDNAARYSPPSTPITVSGRLLHDGGVLLRVDDQGIGLTAADQQRYNIWLQGGEADDAATGAFVDGGNVRQGLQVVRRVISDHGIRVSLAGRTPRGTAALVYIPAGLLCEIAAGGQGDPQLGAASDRVAVGRRQAPVVVQAAAAVTPSHAKVAFRPASSAPANSAAASGRLPVRTPISLRPTAPAPSPLGRPDAAADPGIEADDLVDQLVAFDAATRGTPPADGSGRTTR